MKGVDRYAWFGKLCEIIAGTDPRNFDEDPGFPRALGRLIEHLPKARGDTAEAYLARVSNASALLALVHNALTRPAALDVELQETAEFIDRFNAPVLDSLRQFQFAAAVDRCVREHDGDPALLERLLERVLPELEYDADVLRDALSRAVQRLHEPEVAIEKPRIAAIVSVAIDAFKDRSRYTGSRLEESELIARATKRFREAIRVHAQTSRQI
ncbi:MAG TPA: hypothetical protein VFN67_42540 [Polyangiales bacterium]|nr:hypothetical protein [Polyangiales bacterium]